MTGVIYGLCDPRDGRVRYIGKAVDHKKRLRMHICDSVNGSDKTHKAHWIRQLVASGVTPVLSILSTCASRHYLNEMERVIIRLFRERGAQLTNLTPGGEGGGYTPTPETREKLSISMKKRPAFSFETRARMSAAGRVKVLTPEHRAKLKATLMVTRADPTIQAKQRDIARTSPACIAQRERLHASMRGRKRAQVAVAKTAAACRKRLIDQYGTIYESMKDAGAELGISPTNISTMIHGRRPHVRGYVFRLYEAPTEMTA